MFYSGDKSDNSSLRHSISSNSERLLQSGKGGARIYRSLCNKDQVDGTSKKLQFIKETLTYQVEKFSAFLCRRRCMRLGLP